MQILHSGSSPDSPTYLSDKVLLKRRAGPEDLVSLLRLEEACFDESRRDTRDTIRRGFRLPHQETWIWELGGDIAGAVALRFVRGGMRIYSLATHPRFRGRGIGNEILRWAFKRAQECASKRVTLEVDAADKPLISWYERNGFRQTSMLLDYYEEGRHAWRMKRQLGTAFEE